MSLGRVHRLWIASRDKASRGPRRKLRIASPWSNSWTIWRPELQSREAQLQQVPSHNFEGCWRSAH